MGVMAGLIAVAFKWALVGSERLRLLVLTELHRLPHADAWGWAALGVLGIVCTVVVTWAVERFAPHAAGSGIPHLKGVLLHVREMRWRALLPVKFVGGVLGIGAGLSLGREGPTVQMGAGCGQALADVLRVPSRGVPQLLSCGAGAGIAAAFNAPLAGFLFVIEELHRELSARTFAGALVAALSADIVARALAGDLPSFAVSGLPALPLSLLPVAAAIGITGGLVGVVFNRSIITTRRHVLRSGAARRRMIAGACGAACGLAAWWMPEAVGAGHLTAERLLTGHLAFGVGALLLLLCVKFVLTCASHATGAPGGIFAPMLLMGAVAGSVAGEVIALASPGLRPVIPSLAVLGMAAVFVGSVRAPLTAIVLAVEMTGNYHLLLALGVTCLLSDLAAGVLRDEPIYEALLKLDLQVRPAGVAEQRGAVAPRTVYVGVQRSAALAGRSIRESGVPAGCLIVGVERAGREVHPEADLVLAPGDHLTVLIPEDEAEKAMLVAHMATGL